MHPTLQLDTECTSFINLLIECHNEYKFKQYIGYCNQLKTNLNNCLFQEHVKIRKSNKSKADENKQKWKELQKQFI